MSESGQFYHARRSSEVLPEDIASLSSKFSKRSKQRSPLGERSPSQINKERNKSQPTIRLVNPEAHPPHAVYEKTPFPHLDSQVLKPPKTTKHGYTVQNDGAFSSLDARLRDRSASPKRTSKLFPQLSLKKANRISSSTTTSHADTLLNYDALHSPTLPSPASRRFSGQSTLRNTPTPGLQEELYQRQKEAVLGPFEDASTIRPVTASSGTPESNSTDRITDPRSSTYLSYTHTGNQLLIHPAFRQIAAETDNNRQSRLSDIESVDTRISEAQPRDISKLTSAEYDSELESSTPNITRVGSHVIRYARSDESMSIQYPQVRPPTARSQSTTESYAESDSLPSLHVARKRQHGHSSSAGPAYHRARPLSTIASEPEPSSANRAGTRNHPNYGTAGPSRLNFSRPRARTLGSSSHSLQTSASSQLIPETSVMDLTGFSLIREDSAVPVPLFSESPVELPGDMPAEFPSGLPYRETTNEEGEDTIMELQKPRLRKQRSGYGLNVGYKSSRRHSDPPPGSSHSLQAEDRTSEGSTIFPQWAKVFYNGKSKLASESASRASLSRPDSQAFSTRSPVRMMPWAHHRRFESGWESYATGETGFTHSRPGTPESRWIESPGRSSHFLPSIFRPANRTRAYTDMTFESSHPSDAFYDESDASDRETGRDSLEITPAPPRHTDLYATRHPSPLSPLGSAHPNITRNQRQQRQHDQGDFTPREPSYQFADDPAEDRAYSSPHLQPSRRQNNRLSQWRAPSFDESLSTLVKTRQNRQITLFCMGFVCPLLWIVAAFLPIPRRPMDPRISEDALKVEDGGAGPRYSVGPDAFDWQQETRYLKARWWRHLNRIMSVVGIAVIGAIVSSFL